MNQHAVATRTQLLFNTSASEPKHLNQAEFTPVAQAPRALCRFCARAPARLSLTRSKGSHVELCLRCHHSVMKQRQPPKIALPSRPSRPSLSSRLSRSSPPALIIPRGAGLPDTAKYAELTHRRRRAQVAARRALESEPVTLRSVQRAS